MTWGLLAFIFYLKWRGFFIFKKFWYFGPFTSLVYSLLAFYVFIFYVGSVASDPDRESIAERLSEVRAIQNDLLEIDLLLEQLEVEPGNLKWGIPLIEAYSRIPKTDPIYSKYRIERDTFIKEQIRNTVLGDDCERAFASHLVSYWYYTSGDALAALYFADQEYSCVSNEFLLLKARLLRKTGEVERGNELGLKLLDDFDDPTEVFAFLTSANPGNEDFKAVLVQHKRAIRYFNFWSLKDHWIQLGDWGEYFKALYFGILLRYHPFYVFISFLIVMVVGYYLYTLDVFDRDSLSRLIRMFILGCAIVPLTLFLYDMYDHGWAWFEPFAGDNMWLQQIFKVGLTEEVTKLSVLLVAVYALKWANEPLDYIIYSSMGALAFAFLENTMYFDRTDGNVVFSRTIFSTIGHITFSAIISYGLAVNRFRYNKKIPVILLIPILLLLASAWHGTFNTILSLGTISYFVFVPYIVITMAILGGMINNCINNSPHFDNQLITRNDYGISLIATAFVWLYIVQQAIFIYLSEQYDQSAYNMVKTLFFVGLMVVILSHYLGAFDIVRGHWISFPNMIFGRKKDRNMALGLNCEIYTTKIDEVDHLTEYLFGRITDRVVIKRDNAFFLVRLRTPYTFEGEEYRSVLVHHDLPRHRIMTGVEMFVHFVVPVKKKFSLAKANPRADFAYVGKGYIVCSEGIQTIPDDFGLIHREEGDSIFLV